MSSPDGTYHNISGSMHIIHKLMNNITFILVIDIKKSKINLKKNQHWNFFTDYEAQLKILNDSLAAKSNCLKTAETALKNLTSLPTNQVAKSQIDEIEKRIVTFENKLVTLRNSTEVISAEEKNLLLCEHEKLLKEYRLNGFSF